MLVSKIQAWPDSGFGLNRGPGIALELVDLVAT